MVSASFANHDADFVSMASPIPVGGSPTGTGESPVLPISQTGSKGFTVVLGFAGAREDVQYQLAKARELGASTPSSLEYEKQFWSLDSNGAPKQVSVLPSEIVSALAPLGKVQFVARAGNGVICYRGGPDLRKPDLPRVLTERVKDAFDPKRVFPALPL
jgi:hypothetical protein